jgi:dihydroorotate dehydrogenase (fumarate)
MADLRTSFLGIEIKNPIVAGASNFSNDLDKLKQIENAGAGAVVYKSLFEEQIQLERAQLDEELTEFNERHPEMVTTHPYIEHAGPKEHLVELEKAKKNLNIPVIASLNAIFKDTWVEYAQRIVETGVDGIELNFYKIPNDFEKDGIDIEEEQIDILKSIRSKISIPISVKISPFYTNTLNVIRQMDEESIDNVVVFNRMFEPDIDIKQQDHKFPFNLSSKGDYKLAVRFAGLLYDQINANISANTGIYSGEDVVKLILAGADTTQVVSTLYKNGIDHIQQILKDIEKWMDENNYSSIKDFKGKLAQSQISDPFVYRRAQYVDILMNPHEIIKQYKY